MHYQKRTLPYLVVQVIYIFFISLIFIRTLCESSVSIPSSATTTSRPSSQGVVKIPLKRKVSTGTGNAESGGTSAEKPKKKTKLDNAEEKENKNLAKLSWPEQLVRSKAAKVAAAAASSRATTTSRHSVDR